LLVIAIYVVEISCFFSTGNFVVPRLNHSLQMRVNMGVKWLLRQFDWLPIMLKLTTAKCTQILLMY